MDVIEVQAYGGSGIRPVPADDYTGGLDPSDHPALVKSTIESIETDFSTFSLEPDRLSLPMGLVLPNGTGGTGRRTGMGN